MIGWILRVFARRAPDPDIEATRAKRAGYAAAANEASQRAHAVAAKVVSESPQDQLRGSFRRMGGRLRG